MTIIMMRKAALAGSRCRMRSHDRLRRCPHLDTTMMVIWVKRGGGGISSILRGVMLCDDA